MNVEELEDLIRAELRRDASYAPSGRGVRAAVLAAAVPTPIERPARRWAVPLLVAAAVVALAVAATLLPRAIGRHSQPANPSPTLPAAPPPVGVNCAAGQRLVSGAGARFTDAVGKVGYAYDYYCTGIDDGTRTGSQLEWFRMVNGRLAYQAPSLTRPSANEYVMSLTGTDDGLLVRVYDASPGLAGHPGGAVLDLRIPVDDDSGTSVGDVIAQPCLAGDLTVRTTHAYEPSQHEVLQLANHSSKPCAVWGNPRYLQTSGSQRATSLPVLVGPIGGLAGEPSAPPLLLQPGQLASASIGGMQVDNCVQTRVTAVLPNGVQLGKLDYAPCLGGVVSYPLVRAENGSEGHPELNAPASATGSCLSLNAGDLLTSFGGNLTGNRQSMTVTLSSQGSASCTIKGYPDVRVLDQDENLQKYPFPAQTLRGPAGGLTGDEPPEVTVSPGHPATALVEWSTIPANGRCDSGGQLWFTWGDNSVGSGPLSRPSCAIQVHPFVAGSTGTG